MKYLFSLFFAVFLMVLASCESNDQPTSDTSTDETTTVVGNPPAPGFDLEGSDPKAMALADAVMEAMGGRAAWDDTRYLQWTFFGRRTLLWDKHQGRVRISMANDSTIYLLNLNDKTGRVKHNGMVHENPDSLAYFLGRAESIWINDAYWLVMPFKLKDSGVTLTYEGRDTTQAGDPAEVLQLTFKEIGRTPDNKYHVYLNPEDFRVIEWRYFKNFKDSEPAMITPWLDYQKYGNIFLSGDRGRSKLTGIAVYNKVPDIVFATLDPVPPEDWE